MLSLYLKRACKTGVCVCVCVISLQGRTCLARSLSIPLPAALLISPRIFSPSWTRCRWAEWMCSRGSCPYHVRVKLSGEMDICFSTQFFGWPFFSSSCHIHQTVYSLTKWGLKVIFHWECRWKCIKQLHAMPLKSIELSWVEQHIIASRWHDFTSTLIIFFILSLSNSHWSILSSIFFTFFATATEMVGILLLSS